MSIFDEVITCADESVYLRCLVHGHSGSGKTTSIGTLPERSTLILVPERGLVPLAGRPFKRLPIHSFETFNRFALDFNKVANSGKRLTIKGDQIHTIVIDSLTALSDMLAQHIIRKKRPEMLTERTAGRSSKPSNVYEDLMTMEDYNLHSNLLGRMVQMLVSIKSPNYNVIITCLSQFKENKQTGQWLQIPEVTGSKAAMNLNRHFDIVGFAMTDPEDETNRVMKTSGGADLIAKDATGKLASIEALDWGVIFQKCGVTNTDDPVTNDKLQPSTPSQNPETTNPQPVNGSGKAATKSTSKPNPEKE